MALRRPVRFISLGACEACKVGRLCGALPDSPFGTGRLSERAGVDLLALRYVAHPEASATSATVSCPVMSSDTRMVSSAARTCGPAEADPLGGQPAEL